MYPIISFAGAKLPTILVFFWLAYFACIFYYIHSARYSALLFYDFSLRLAGGFLVCILGGKAVSLAVRWHELSGSFIEKLQSCGFVFYGGLIGGILGLWIVCRICSAFDLYMVPFYYWTDCFATLLPLAQAIGRIGCFFNGCCYGRQWNGRLGILYPVGSDSESFVYMKVFPTWFVESLYCLFLFLVLRKLWGKDRWYYHSSLRCGTITEVYLLSYAVFRFFLEFMRGDLIRGVFGWISTSQIISFLIIIVIGLVEFYRKSCSVMQDRE